MMDTQRVKIGDVKRGSMIPGFGGAVIAETLSVTADGTPFWWDTDGRRHFGDDGRLTVYVPTVRTDAVGQPKTSLVLHAVTGAGRGACQVSQSAYLDVWESGTALASVTCGVCRSSLNLVSELRK